MPAIPEAEFAVQPMPAMRVSAAQFAAVSAVLAALGASTIAPSIASLWRMWTTDALKSAGMAIPFVSLALALMAWKRIGWRAEGTWWGLALLVVAAAGAWLEGRGNVVMVFSPGTSRVFPPPAFVLLMYGVGVTLLLGGMRLLRAAAGPVLLLLLANPVPRVFSLWVDVPLQQMSAEVARGLAIHLGQHLTPDRLRLMFTPDFGMFIAPGCNGLRGAVTMGLIALVAGYAYRFRWIATALIAAGAVLLGYAFNLLRLCLLVFYYLIALHLPWLQNKAEQADYAIGAALFFIATLLLFAAIHRLRDRRPREPASEPMRAGADENPGASRAQAVRLAVFAAAAVVACFGIPQAIAEGQLRTVPEGVQPFPEHVGGYTRQRIWKETDDVTGEVIYLWAQYAPAGTGLPVAIGVSPTSDWHNPLVCHSVRGEVPIWQGQVAAGTAGPQVEFVSGFYNNGVTQFVEASTMCTDGSCGEFQTERSHLGFVYSFPRLRLLSSAAHAGSTRVLLRVETTNMVEPGDEARSELVGTLRAFLQNTRLDELTQAVER